MLSFHPLGTTIKFRENLQDNKVEVYYFPPPKEKEQGSYFILQQNFNKFNRERI